MLILRSNCYLNKLIFLFTCKGAHTHLKLSAQLLQLSAHSPYNQIIHLNSFPPSSLLPFSFIPSQNHSKPDFQAISNLPVHSALFPKYLILVPIFFKDWPYQSPVSHLSKHNSSLMLRLLRRQIMRFGVKDAKPIMRGKYLEGRYNKIHDWQSRLANECKRTKPKVPQVEAFKQYIRENPVAKMYLQGGLDQIPAIVFEYYTDEDQCLLQKPRKGISYGLTWEELLDQFAVITYTAPKFSDEDIIGVPFYALVIDLLNTDFGRTFFALDDVNTHFKPIYEAYGKFLDSPASLKYLTTDPENGWLSSPRVDYNDFICDTSQPNFGFKSWHEWFTREIKESARPFDKNAVNTIINNSEHYPNFDMPKRDVKWHDKFWLKDQRYSLAEMFGADHLPAEEQAYYRNAFEGGTVYQGFLNPWCYHRWRSPVSGVVERSYKIGNSYYAGNPSLSFHLAESYIASQPLLTMTSVRQIYVIKADNPKIGRVAIIEIGMAEVSGIVNKINNGKEIKQVKEGCRIEKGDLLGMFRFGGSSHAYIFDKNAQNLTFSDSIYKRVKNNKTGVDESVLQPVRTPLAYVS